MKKNVVYKLLYRASQDGYNVQTFHQKCDNIFGTLTMLKQLKEWDLEGTLKNSGMVII